MTLTVSILKVYHYPIKHPGTVTYKDLTLHLNPSLADNKDLEAARVSKFLNGNMKSNLRMLIPQFVQRRDAEKRETEGLPYHAGAEKSKKKMAPRGASSRISRGS